MATYADVGQEKMILRSLNDARDDSTREDRDCDTPPAISGGEGIAKLAV